MQTSPHSQPVRSSAPPAAEIEIVDPLKGEAWDEAVLTREDQSIFHRSAWARVLAESYGHQPNYLKIHGPEAGPVLIPLMEVRSALTGRRGVSLPFSDFAGPLTDGAESDGASIEAIHELAVSRGWSHVDLRGGRKPAVGVEAHKCYLGHELDLRGGVDAVASRIHSATRRAIRKAERSGLETRIGTGSEELESFYHLHGRTRRRHGLPPQPISFFRAIQRNILAAGLGEIALASFDGRVIAGALFLRSEGKAVYKFGASESCHWDLRPNQLVMWSAIKHLESLGCQALHFGRTSPGDQGLGQFKRSWGGVEHDLSYYRHRTKETDWMSNAAPSSDSGSRIFGHLPLAINRVAGRLIYPHLD